MSKSKSYKWDENTRGLLRQLRAENIQLRRELKVAQRKFNIKVDEIEEVKEPNRIVCPECREGDLEIMEVVGRSYATCTHCFYRRRLV